MPAASAASAIAHPGSSDQAPLHRGCQCPQRQLRRIRLRPRTPQGREDLRDELRLLNAGDDLEPTAAARTALDLNAEHALQAPRPAHRHVQTPTLRRSICKSEEQRPPMSMELQATRRVSSRKRLRDITLGEP
jgi:hypothetical protein